MLYCKISVQCVTLHMPTAKPQTCLHSTDLLSHDPDKQCMSSLQLVLTHVSRFAACDRPSPLPLAPASSSLPIFPLCAPLPLPVPPPSPSSLCTLAPPPALHPSIPPFMFPASPLPRPPIPCFPCVLFPPRPHFPPPPLLPCAICCWSSLTTFCACRAAQGPVSSSDALLQHAVPSGYVAQSVNFGTGTTLQQASSNTDHYSKVCHFEQIGHNLYYYCFVLGTVCCLISLLAVCICVFEVVFGQVLARCVQTLLIAPQAPVQKFSKSSLSIENCLQYVVPYKSKYLLFDYY